MIDPVTLVIDPTCDPRHGGGQISGQVLKA